MSRCPRHCRRAASTPCARGRAFVELGDDAEPRCGPRSGAAGELSGARDHPRRGRGAAGRRGRHRGVLARHRRCSLAVGNVESELRRTAEDGDLVIAVTDAETRILWTYGGRVMRRKAETVNFVPGGRWDESSVGTNALAISNRTGDPSMVFSAEHYASIVHNWVCWAAPLHDPVSGRADRRHRPVDDLGPHPPDRAGHRAGDGAADRDRDAALAAVVRRRPRAGRRPTSPASRSACSAPPRRGSTGSGCCSTAGRPRSSRC